MSDPIIIRDAFFRQALSLNAALISAQGIHRIGFTTEAFGYRIMEPPSRIAMVASKYGYRHLEHPADAARVQHATTPVTGSRKSGFRFMQFRTT